MVVGKTTSSVSVQWTPPAAAGGPIDAYDVQYRQPTKVSDWMSIPNAGVMSNQKHEKQTVTTRADAGSTITDGWFRLSFGYNGINGFDPESRSLTDRIPYSASADEMQNILQR